MHYTNSNITSMLKRTMLYNTQYGGFKGGIAPLSNPKEVNVIDIVVV